MFFRKVFEDVECPQAQLDKVGMSIDLDKKVVGGTVLRLTDSARDFEHLLRIFYHGSE